MAKQPRKVTGKKRMKQTTKEAEVMFLDLFIDLCEGDDLKPFLEHIGFKLSAVPANAGPEQFFECFKGHYTTDGVLDGVKPFKDFATYPPIASRVVELQIERDKVA